MNSVETCPPPAALRQFLLGELDRNCRAAVVGHLEVCADCRRRLDCESSPALPPAVATSAARSAEFGPAFYRVIDALAAPADAAETLAADADWYLRLLEPAGDPRYLGRLDRYDVAEVCGQGGMGIVFRAHDPALGRDVAIKILAPHLAGRRTAHERFAREARAAATIHHENVVSIYTISEAGGLPFLVMPYVVGRSLAERLEQERRLPIVEVLRIGRQAALGLAAAHERGVVHRDIKPSNLLLEAAEGRVKIADFGLAFLVDGNELTHSGTIPGTPEFMAPEQARGDPVDARSDLFSLGTVLYVAATGRSPFQGTTPLAALRRVCDTTPPPIGDVRSEATAWLTAVVERLMRKNPADRYQQAAEVAESFGRQLALWSQRRRPSQPPRSSASPALHAGESPVTVRSTTIVTAGPLRAIPVGTPRRESIFTGIEAEVRIGWAGFVRRLRAVPRGREALAIVATLLLGIAVGMSLSEHDTRSYEAPATGAAQGRPPTPPRYQALKRTSSQSPGGAKHAAQSQRHPRPARAAKSVDAGAQALSLIAGLLRQFSPQEHRL